MKSGKFLITKSNIYSHFITENTDTLSQVADRDFPLNYSEIYDKIGKFYKEAGQVSQFYGAGNDFILFFSFLEPLSVLPGEKKFFGTPMIYSEIFFENQEEVHKRAIDNIFHFYASNLEHFHNVAVNVSTNNYDDFCKGIKSERFLSQLMQDSNNINGILEEIIFLEKLGYSGGIKTVYSYAFLKHEGYLYPVDITDVGRYQQLSSSGYTATDILILTKGVKKFNRLYYFMLLRGFTDFYKQLSVQPYTYEELNLYYKKFFIEKLF